MKEALRKIRSPRGGLFSKYVISFVGLVVFVLAMNGAVEVWIIYRETSSSLVRAQSEKADAIARRIEQFIQEAERQISWATRASVTTVEQRRADYAVLLQQVPAIDELTQLDGNGREQLKLTRRGATLGSNADFSREPKFTETVARRSWYGPVYFRGIDPYMTIALAHSGRNAGVTVAETDLRSLAEFVGESEMSKASYAYVVGPQGRLLAHTDMALLGRGTETPGLPQVAAVRNAGGEPSMTGTDLDGRSVLTASVQIPRLNWHVFVEQPLSQAFAPIYNLLKRLGWLLALGLSVAFLAALLLARRMVVPIRALQAGARELGESEFGHRIAVRSGDELEELADQFNRMAEKLKESYSALETKVEERTRDLAQSVRELKALEEIGRAVTSSLELKAVLATIVTRAVELTQADAGAIYAYDAATHTYELAEAHGMQQDFIDAIRVMRIDEDAVNAMRVSEHESVLGLVERKREPISIPDLSRTPKYPLRDLTVAAGFNSVLIVPLVGPDEVMGALVLQRKATGDFPANTIGLMQTFANQSALAMHNAELFQEVEEKGRELAIANEHKSQFFANMSHELRTPLNAVLGYSELLVDGLYGTMPQKALEVLERIQANGKHLLGLINDVLDISKIEAGHLTLALEDYSMKALVESVVASTGSLAQAKGLEVTSEVPDDLPLGRGDDRRLTQVLLNIVSNAIKFTDKGSVGVRVKAVNGEFNIAVKDTGPGIAPDDQKRIFEEFQQVDNTSTRHKGGTGLGLSISRRLIDLHGGRIDLESAPGAGSTFHIVVPVRVTGQRSTA
jgi:signal transduction histidine kinase